MRVGAHMGGVALLAEKKKKAPGLIKHNLQFSFFVKATGGWGLISEDKHGKCGVTSTRGGEGEWGREEEEEEEEEGGSGWVQGWSVRSVVCKAGPHKARAKHVTRSRSDTHAWVAA